MIETKDNFFNRVYVNFINETAFVYHSKIGVGIPVKWTIAQTKQYLNYIEANQEPVV